jgi:uncharacterized membrane protein YphA (DoxX/SURF4 family)
VLSQTFWVLVLGVICLFAFFVAIGALSPSGAIGLTIAMVILIAAWVVHATWEARRRSGQDEAARRARERRGF